MNIKLLHNIDQRLLVASYAIPDIFSLSWTLIRYGTNERRIQIIILLITFYD